MTFLSVYFLKSSNTIWTTALRDSERKAYRTSQSFLFELLFDLFLLINFSQLVSDWLHQRGFFLIFSFFFFSSFKVWEFPSSCYTPKTKRLQHLYQASKLFLLHWLRGKWSDMYDVLCYGFQRRYQATYTVDVHICCPNLLFSWSFVLGHFIFFPLI